MIGDRLDLAQNTINDRLESEIRNCEKAIESKLNLKNPADLVGDAETPMPEVLAWAMIGDRLNLAQNTINDRFQSEIPDLEKLIQSRLKIKNPADLIGVAETLMPRCSPGQSN